MNMIEKYGTLHEAPAAAPLVRRGLAGQGPDRPERRQAAARLGRHRRQRPESGKVAPAQGAAPPQAAGPEAGPADLQGDRIARTSGSSSTSTSSARRQERRRDGRRRRNDEARLLARLRLARVHPRAARLDGAGRAELDLELVELDRANCCGAGVIAEHNQELADTLNARTFAMAQAVEGAAGMMNICSTCQGAQSECQERLDADDRLPRARQHPPRATRASTTRSDGAWWNKNFLWLLVEEIGLDALRERVVRPLDGLRVAPVLRLLHRPPDQAAGLRGPPRARPLPRAGHRGARRRRRSTTPGATSAAASRSSR